MNKPIALLKRWVIAHREPPSEYILIGDVFNHESLPDGSRVMTNKIRTIDFVNLLAETENIFYRLDPVMGKSK